MWRPCLGIHWRERKGHSRDSSMLRVWIHPECSSPRCSRPSRACQLEAGDHKQQQSEKPILLVPANHLRNLPNVCMSYPESDAHGLDLGWLAAQLTELVFAKDELLRDLVVVCGQRRQNSWSIYTTRQDQLMFSGGALSWFTLTQAAHRVNGTYIIESQTGNST